MQKALLLFITIYLSNFVAQALVCKDLLIPPIEPYLIQTDSSRIEMTKVTNEGVSSKLFIEKAEFSEDVNTAVIEMIRMLVQNSDYKLEDKNVLTKNKFTLGIPIKDGYVLQLSYASKSNANPRFILQDKIALITPSGKEFKISDEIIDRDEIKINKSEFELKEFAILGANLKLKIPLVIDGLLLNKFSQLAEYFKYFKKDELAKIFKSNNMLKIETLFQLRRAKSVFYNLLIKAPFKYMIGGALMFGIMNYQFVAPTHTDVPLTQGPVISTAYIANTIKNLPLPSHKAELKKEYTDLQAELSHKMQNYSNFNFLDMQLDTSNAFSRENNLFVYEKVNENTGSKHTYIVISQDVSSNQSTGMLFSVVEISAAKYPNLIKYIKNQGKISSVQ